jgi:hypothetical protein
MGGRRADGRCMDDNRVVDLVLDYWRVSGGSEVELATFLGKVVDTFFRSYLDGFTIYACRDCLSWVCLGDTAGY